MSAASTRRGIPFVIAAPSGTGKTTVCREIVESEPSVVFSISHTTRHRRPEEVDGRDYHFVSPAEFQELVEEGAFLEWAIYNDHHYGTSHEAIDRPLAEGRDVLLEIEVQGARQVRARRLDARFIFLFPPSMKTLQERLRLRDTDSEEDIARRLEVAAQELGAAELFDYAVVNGNLGRCVARVRDVIRAERADEVEALRRELLPADAVARLRAEAAG